MTKITHIEIDDRNLPPPTPEIDQERKVAMFDLLEDNSFTIPARDGREAPEGPYRLALSIKERRLVFDLKQEDESPAVEFHLQEPLQPAEQIDFIIDEQHGIGHLIPPCRRRPDRRSATAP